MNIAYLHTGYFPSASPSFTFSAFNAMALAKVFETCHFFIKRNSSLSPEKVISLFFDLSMPPSLVIHPMRDFSFLRTNQWYVKRVEKQLQKFIRERKVDGVIARHPVFLQSLSKLRKQFGIPVFYETHDFYADLSLRNDVRAQKKAKFEKWEKTWIPHLSGVICLQEAQKEFYQAVFPDQRIEVARTGLWQLYRLPHREFRYLTYIGSLDFHKGIDFLLEAIAHSQTRPPLLIIGGKNKAEIEQMERKIQNRKSDFPVQITGWVDKKTLSAYLAQTVVGVVPLQDTFFNRYLTSPLKIFDYYSHGIPVIAPDFPTMRELIQENKTGVFFEPGNPIALAEKIDYFFSNLTHWNQWSEAVYQHAENFTWEKRAQRILEIVTREKG